MGVKNLKSNGSGVDTLRRGTNMGRGLGTDINRTHPVSEFLLRQK